MEIENFVPSDKHDIAAVLSAERAGYPAVAAILDKLVAWTADGNWPVAMPLARFLASLGDPVVEPVMRVLTGNDSTHKHFCLILIVPFLPADVLEKLHETLCQLSTNPNDDDRAEQVDRLAQDVLAKIS
jgi:hypothetical protein